MARKPNILFVNTDQHSWHALSAFGNTHLHTPNIDRLQEHGVSFMRSYCTDPVCMAARAGWMTGRCSSETGMPFNGGIVHGHLPDLGQILNSSGYHACHCGKWHVDGRDVRESFRNLYFGKRDIQAGGAEYYDSASTHAALDFLSWYDRDRPFFLHLGYVNPHDICEYLHNHEQKKIPGPLEQGIIPESELPPLPENFSYDESETAVQQVFRRADDALIHPAILRAVKNWTSLQWRYYIWNYYRYIEKADQEIGLVLNALCATPFRDNTVIIFSSDHGEACASHQMFQKFTLYEESIRVPLIVACLGDGIQMEKGAFDHQHLVSGVDLLPTICDYAGVDAPAGLSGASIRPLVEGTGQLRPPEHQQGARQLRNPEQPLDAEPSWRNFVLVESNYWARAIVTERYKYITEYRPKAEEDFVPPGPDPDALGSEQLFDLQTDQGETLNLAFDAFHQDILENCRKKLLEYEETLVRPPLTQERPRNIISRWSRKLRAHWEKRDKSGL